MRQRTKFSGTVLVSPGAVLNGELVTDYERVAGSHRTAIRFYVVLQFGDHPLARWDVTDRRAEIEEQSGDYWDEQTREQHEEAFVEKFIGERLATLFGGLEGAIKP